MTITELVRFHQQNRATELSQVAPQLENGSLPPPGHVNPYCPPGMDITGTTSADRKIIPVDEGVANQLRNIAYRRMIESGGMGEGDDIGIVGRTINAYVMTLPPEDRINAGWTLNEIFIQEAERLAEYVHQRDPSWNWGKNANPSILEGYQRGVDIVV